MRGSRKKVNGLLHFVLCIFLIILVSACGDAIYSTSETGSITFSVEWQGAPSESPGRYTAVLNCAAAGVATVEAEVYDENDSYLAGGGPWNCDDHSGTITGVPAGSNRKVVILGKDSSGNVLYRGEATGITVIANQSTDAGTITLASTRTEWVKLLGTLSEDRGYGTAVDSNGNSYVTGYTYGDLAGNTNAGESDIFVAKYNTNGTRQWTKLLGTSDYDEGYGTAVDSNGNIYVIGYTYGDLAGNTNAGESDIFVAKYNTNGTRQWTKLLGTSDYDFGFSIAVDSNGNIYITGWTYGDLAGNTNAGERDIFVAKYNTNGTRQWTKLLGTSDFDTGLGIAVDSNGNSYITGWTEGDLAGNNNAGESDIYVAKYNTNGTRQWTELLGTSDYDEGRGIAVDSNDNIYVTGYAKGDLDGNTSAGGNDIFVAKYDADGTRQWTELLGTSDEDTGYGITVDSSGNVFITGSTSGGLEENTNAGEEDIFIWKLVDIDDGVLAKTELLKGYWHFYYTIGTTQFERYYTLDTITDNTNSQGGYYIYGTDEYGDSINACYWPDDEYWTLLDPATTIDRYYAFYTDGSEILETSCYYQINNSTGDWSSCYTLYGDKNPLSTAQIKASLMEAIESDEMVAIEGEQETVDDSIKEKYWQLRQIIDLQE